MESSSWGLFNQVTFSLLKGYLNRYLWDADGAHNCPVGIMQGSACLFLSWQLYLVLKTMHLCHPLHLAKSGSERPRAGDSLYRLCSVTLQKCGGPASQGVLEARSGWTVSPLTCRSANSAGRREMPQEICALGRQGPLASERRSAGRNELVRCFSRILPQAKRFKSQLNHEADDSEEMSTSALR
ncbi:RING finger protein 141 isoform X3 [Vidua chalybeata]|uniref:RING finger protein 141 isoform X3 n=1 Tax=Vidua chalybeata TaxID=81927 RepID=UPI0023A7A9C5|nr:RING finger protein 141 isoform X3 [Vidua chalybeata]